MTALTENLNEKVEALRCWFRQHKGVAVAFSGGVDSSLVLKIAVDELGGDSVLAVMAISPSLPTRDRNEALRVAAEIGVTVEMIDTQETQDPRYQANPANRCYYCKEHVYGDVATLAAGREIPMVVDGMNREDTLDVRPGRAAAMKQGVRSPLSELGFSKDEVRAAARSLGLPNWNKPAAACLASRVAYGLPVSDGLLSRIERAEDVLHALGFNESRVRHHGDVARIEVPISEHRRMAEMGQAVAAEIRRFGWQYVTLDLDGLQHGSMNRVLGKKQS
ncbi:MAG: ATP-dependent sacrificial sulfur transferase LarE [Verrucomicrobiales bacterium]|nr:ATP-dependent sacrificial sulfur transferase LarE [Verrucomicrobiales bacterium]MCP5560037.1 ATP-dependent sacrificial sulfur transferase LarE [Verrucomicrobiaceae bacterium]